MLNSNQILGFSRWLFLCKHGNHSGAGLFVKKLIYAILELWKNCLICSISFLFKSTNEAISKTFVQFFDSNFNFSVHTSYNKKVQNSKIEV